jgi:hypothetical protein
MAGCVVYQPVATRPIPMTNAFDPKEAQHMLRRGTNTVKGSAHIRREGGDLATCAGMEVALIPATEYAVERTRIQYNSGYVGYLPAVAPSASNPRPTPATTDPEYVQISRTVTCDAKGDFTFQDVAEGSFFIITSVVWRDGFNTHGGTLMRRVDLEGRNLTVQLVLTPP